MAFLLYRIWEGYTTGGGLSSSFTGDHVKRGRGEQAKPGEGAQKYTDTAGQRESQEPQCATPKWGVFISITWCIYK